MNIQNTFYSSLAFFRRHFSKTYFSVFSIIFFVLSMSLSSCSENNDNWEELDSEKMVLAASLNSTSSANSSNKNEFERVLDDFLTIPSASQLKEYIHPQEGFYINHKPGAISVVEHFTDLDEVYEQLPHLESYFKKFNGKNPKNEEIPQFNCEVFSKQGTFYQTISSFNKIEKGLEINERMIDRVHSQEEKELAKETDKRISRIVVVTDDYLEIGFTNIDGKWYMVWFDLAKFDCSA